MFVSRYLVCSYFERVHSNPPLLFTDSHHFFSYRKVNLSSILKILYFSLTIDVLMFPKNRTNTLKLVNNYVTAYQVMFLLAAPFDWNKLSFPGLLQLVKKWITFIEFWSRTENGAKICITASTRERPRRLKMSTTSQSKFYYILNPHIVLLW